MNSICRAVDNLQTVTSSSSPSHLYKKETEAHRVHTASTPELTPSQPMRPAGPQPTVSPVAGRKGAQQEASRLPGPCWQVREAGISLSTRQAGCMGVHAGLFCCCFGQKTEAPGRYLDLSQRHREVRVGEETARPGATGGRAPPEESRVAISRGGPNPPGLTFEVPAQRMPPLGRPP